MSESYQQNRLTHKNTEFKQLDKRYVFKGFGGDGITDLTGYFQRALEEHYDSLCDKDERTEFWREWCMEQDGQLMLPDWEMETGEYLLRPYLTWLEEHVLCHYDIPDMLKSLMLAEVVHEYEEVKRKDSPQWAIELERRWGDYQEELGYKPKCALCPEPLDDKYGHNPAPLGKKGDRCCSDCNGQKVIPARLADRF